MTLCLNEKMKQVYVHTSIGFYFFLIFYNPVNGNLTLIVLYLILHVLGGPLIREDAIWETCVLIYWGNQGW